MIKTYAKKEEGRTKVFFVVGENGEVVGRKVGNHVISMEMGFQFYVDDHIAEQIHKCELYMDGILPRLRVQEGETIYDNPAESGEEY